MTKPLTVKRVERLRKWSKVSPWFFALLGPAALVAAGLMGKDAPPNLQFMGWLYTVLGVGTLLYFRWLGSKRRRHSVPTPALADGEVVLWMDDVNDRQARFGRRGGLTITNRRLAFEPVEDRFDPMVGREWPVDTIESVRIDPIVLADGEVNSGTLVFDLGAAGEQRFDVFDSEGALARITPKLDELKSSQS